jgi:hypothetical protein
MTFPAHLPGARLRASFFVTGVAVCSAGLLLLAAPGAGAAVTPVPLGTAAPFVVLAGAGITNTGPTTLNGDLGTFPTTSVSGAGSMTITGTNHGGDAVTQGAKNALVTAYNSAAGQTPATPIAADLAGQTLAPGVYNSASSIGLTGALTLDGGGNPQAVFVFQAGSTLTTASASTVTLVNGAQACNVFWQVGSSATLGTGSQFRGSILALTSITVTTGATVEGRVLARNGAVTLDTNTITRPRCAATMSASPTATASAKPTSKTTHKPAAGPTSGPGSSATPQVGLVPRGPVDSGSDTTSPRTGAAGLVGGGLVVMILAGAATLAVRRRHAS